MIDFQFKHQNKYSKLFATRLLIGGFDHLKFGIFVLVILLFSFSLEYINYLNFTKFNKNRIEVLVENQYLKTKNNKKYFIFKFLTKNNFKFYSSSRNKLKNLKGHWLKIDVLIPKDFNFYNYLKGTYLITFNYEQISHKPTLRYQLSEKLKQIHFNQKIAELYSALFLATPIGKDLRKDLVKLGIVHLVVLSGFHVGFIIFLIFMLFKFICFPFYKRFFPYRNMYRDLFLISTIIITSYLIFINSPPSFFRAVLMFILGFIFFDRNMILSPFQSLTIILILILSIAPRMFFNIGFWFSISGVFFIFFYLEFIKKGFILFNFWVLFAMMPIIHYFFPYFYFLQLFSPIWNILFLIFYPFSFFLHLIGMGDFLDRILIYFLNLGNNTILTQEFQISTPLTILIIYLSIFFLFIFLKKKSSYN